MSVEQRGSRWRARVRRRGVQRSASFESEQEARAWEAATIVAISRGTELPAIPTPEPEAPPPLSPEERLTVREAIREWGRAAERGSARTREGKRYRDSTLYQHRSRLKLHVIPYIGRESVQDVTRGTLRRWLDELAAERTATTARMALDSLRPVFRRLVDHEVIPANPCAGVQAPFEDEDRPRRFLEVAEGERLREAAHAARPLLGGFVDLGLATGARRGELLALEWGVGGLDLDGRVALIRQSYDMRRGTLGPTKSGKAREVPLGRNLCQRMRELRMAAGRPLDGARVFAFDPRAGFGRARTAAKLSEPQPTIHSLRHTAATWWLAEGMTVHEVATLLGHSDARLIERLYGHALPSRMSDAGDRLERFREAAHI